MATTVTFANNTAGGGGNGPPPAAASDASSGGSSAATATSTAPPAVDPLVAWKNLFNLNDLPDYKVAKGLLVKYEGAAWEDVMAPFDRAYPDAPEMVAKELALAPAAKCALVVNQDGTVQLVYGFRFCHAVAGQGQRVLALGGERLRMTGAERPPDLLTLAGNLAGQWPHFGTGAARAPTMADAIAALDANADLRLVDPLAADANNADANPEITARRALVIHPKLGLLFLQPIAPHKALRLVQKIQQAVPPAYQGRLTPLINFARVAVTATAAGQPTSALRTEWQRLDHGTTTALTTWYYELLGACAERYVAPPPAMQPAAAPQAAFGGADPTLTRALQDLATSQSTIAEKKTTKYKEHELETLFNLCNVPINVDRDRDVSDLPLFWVDFHKYRGKINDARSYIERFYEDHASDVGGLDSVVFSHKFVQDMMAHDLFGRDRMVEWDNRFRGFSQFSVGPVDFSCYSGESQRQLFVRHESANLKLDEVLTLEKKSDKVMQQLVSWPTNILEFRRFMEHMHGICIVFFGNEFKPVLHFQRLAKACSKRQYFYRYRTTHWWALFWKTHMALRQFFVDGD